MPSASLLCACEEYLMVWASLEQRDDWLARAQEEVGREPRWPQRGRITSKVRRVFLTQPRGWRKLQFSASVLLASRPSIRSFHETPLLPQPGPFSGKSLPYLCWGCQWNVLLLEPHPGQRLQAECSDPGAPQARKT
jgi:hypothetical protein